VSLNAAAQYKPQQDQVESFKSKKSEIEQKLEVIQRLERSRSGPVHILDELASRTPERVWLTTLSAKGGRIELEGMSLDNELVALFLTALNDSAYFANVELKTTELKTVDSLKLNTFRIVAQLESPDAPAPAYQPAPAIEGKGKKGAKPTAAPRQTDRREGREWRSTSDSIRSRAARSSRAASPTGWRRSRSSRCWCWAATAGFLPARRCRARVAEARARPRAGLRVRAIVANIAAFEQEIAEMEKRLKQALRQLPDSKELPGLLTDVSSLGKDAGLEFTAFRPRDEIAKDFYAEVPIEVEFSGDFHDIARFFDKVSKLPRIVNVSQLQMEIAGQEFGSTRLKVHRGGDDLPLPRA
jgi:hypothetical protein